MTLISCAFAQLIRVIALRTSSNQTYKLLKRRTTDVLLRMCLHRLIWVFAGRTICLVGNAAPRLIFYSHISLLLCCSFSLAIRFALALKCMKTSNLKERSAVISNMPRWSNKSICRVVKCHALTLLWVFINIWEVGSEKTAGLWL